MFLFYFVFVDVEPTWLCLDPQRLEDALKACKRPKAVMAVHLFGSAFDVDAVFEVCRRHSVTLIEDAAQAIGTKHKGRMAGGAMVAANHHKHAMAAQRKTEELIEADIAASGRTKESFAFFTSFGNEFMDGYGRLLCYLHADKDNWTPEQRKLSYNELLLVAGVVAPYFIYPNIQPFLAGSPFALAQVQPAGFWAATPTSW